MSDNVYSVTEIVGSSSESIEKAIQNAIATASETLRNTEWFEVVNTRGHIVDGKVGHFQVAVKVGFRYDRNA
tara:strand:- start:637 stop:852 length:216 start_codon:yes stop_codon:yes gene_type:complete